MAFPERLLLVLADVHQQVADGMDLSAAIGMADEVFVSELRTSTLHILRAWRADAISDEDRIAISNALAGAVQARMKRLFGRQPVPAAGEAEQVLERAYAAAQQSGE